MNSMKIGRKPYFFVFAIAIFFSLLLGVWAANRQLMSEPLYHQAQLLPESSLLPNFNLEDQYGNAINDGLWRNRWSLIFFGFTTCPDICPLELQKLGALLRLANASSNVQVVFVSVDPERDTLTRLREYASFFHPDIIALRGSNSELATAARFFGAAYDRIVIIDSKLFNVPAGIDMPDNAGDLYQVNHSSRIFIVNPASEYIGSFMPPFGAQQLWNDMEKIINR